MVNEKLCPGVKVITQRRCVELPECPKWKLGEWSQVRQAAVNLCRNFVRKMSPTWWSSVGSIFQ